MTVQEQKAYSLQTLKRLPNYLNYLKGLKEKNVTKISSTTIAEDLGLTEIQVRKDLASVSTNGGKPRVGFSVNELISDIQTFLGYYNVNEAVLVGAGKLGMALMAYKGFQQYGLDIIMAFDNDEAICGATVDGKQIVHSSKIADLCRRLEIKIGIITVPEESAQDACDALIAGGVLAVWNFSPAHLTVPKHILVQNENMAASLAVLSKHLSDRLKITDKTDGKKQDGKKTEGYEVAGAGKAGFKDGDK